MSKISNKSWIRWAVSEAGARTVSTSLVRFAGDFAKTPSLIFFMTALSGLVQVMSAELYLHHKGIPHWEKEKSGENLGAIAFGVFALINTALGFFAYANGAPLALHVFFMTLSIVPGAFIDKWLFGEEFRIPQVIGIATSILATWFILDLPMPDDFASMSGWIGYSLAVPFTMAINQGITRKIQNIDPMVKNFWGGLTTVVLGGVAIGILGNFSEGFDAQNLTTIVWVSIGIGIAVVALWSFSVFAYRGGVGIALKKLVNNACWLAFSLIVGLLAFGEPVTSFQILGVGLFLVAFSLMDKETREWILASIN